MRIVSRNNVDFKTLLAGIHMATDKRVADGVDKLDYKVSDDVKFGMCIAALTDEVNTSPSVESHLHFTVMVLVEEYDLNEIITCGNTLAWTGAATTSRGHLIGLLSGTLPQWRAAIQAGANQMNSKNVTKFYDDLAGMFVQEGINVGFNPPPRIGN